MMTPAPVLTPHGLLSLRQTGEAMALEPERGSRLEKAFERGSGHGLLCLGADEVGTALPPVLSYWRELGARYVTALCALHPLRWTSQQALQFLRDVPALESAGVVVRMPASWRMNRPARPQVKATVGGNAPSQLGMDALLDFRMEVTLDGESLTSAEIKQLLAHSDGLALIRGKWVEVDHERLNRTLEQFEAIERRAATDGLSFGEAMRMLASADIAGNDAAEQTDINWSQTVAGPWLAETLAALRHLDGLSRICLLSRGADMRSSFWGRVARLPSAGLANTLLWQVTVRPAASRHFEPSISSYSACTRLSLELCTRR